MSFVRPIELIHNFEGFELNFIYPEIGSWFQSGNLEKHYDGPTDFNYLYIKFNQLFSPYEKSNKEANLKNVFVVDNDFTALAFEDIKKYANLDQLSKANISEDEAKNLLNRFKGAFDYLKQEIDWNNSKAIITPLMGAGAILYLYSIDKNKLVALNAKRLPLKNTKGYFDFGMRVENFSEVKRIDKLLSNVGKDDELTIIEVCIASGMTTIAFLADLFLKKATPKVINVITLATGEEGLQRINHINDNLFKFNLAFHTAKIAPKLADYHKTQQDALIYPDGSYVVDSPWPLVKKVFKNVF